MSIALDDIIHLVPVGCSGCGGTSLDPQGDNTYKCKYCDALVVRDPPPPLPKHLQSRGGEIPPESGRSELKADMLRTIDAAGGGATVDPRIVQAALDKDGPRGWLTRKPLSAGISVGSAKQHAPVRVQYTCFTERRTIQQTTIPYQGQVPSKDPIPQPWAEDPRELSEPAEEVMPLRVQEVVSDCEDCRGAGSQVCGECRGEGSKDCPFCNGGRKSDGKKCSSCMGDGVRSCSTCDGNKRIACSPCDGEGQVLKGHEMVIVHGGRSETDAMSGDRDWGDQSWLDKAEGELLFDEVSGGMTVLGDGDGPVYAMVKEVVDGLNAELDRTDFVFWSRLTLTRIPVVEAAYGIGGSDSGQMVHVYGRQKAVAMPGKKPWGCGWITMGTPVVLGLLLVLMF